MNRISVLKTASLGVLLVSLWMILEGIWSFLGLYYSISEFNRWGFSDDQPLKVLFALCRTFPLMVGCLLFNFHAAVVRYLLRETDPSQWETISWEDSRTVSSLVVGLLGLVFLARGVQVAALDHFVAGFFLSLPGHTLQSFMTNEVYTSHLALFLAQIQWILPPAYPIFLGTAMLVAAPKIGVLMGNRIEKSLEPPEEKEEEGEDAS